MSSSKIQEYNLDPNMGLAKESSVQEVLSAVGNSGCVKSVQMQYKSVSSSGLNTLTFTISAVNPSKSFVIVTGASIVSNDLKGGAVLYSFTETEVVVKVNTANSNEIGISIQVIEFY